MIVEQTDTVDVSIVARLAAALDMPVQTRLPPLWHWLFFLDKTHSHDLGPDGHRLHGGLLPHAPDLPTRMWAGGRIRLFGPIAFGTTLRRKSTIADIQERQGRTGRLRFVTVKYTIFRDDELVIDEEQDLVYRGAMSRHTPPQPAPPAPLNAAVSMFTPDEVMLFRFSALTFNAHRIHYDHPYATMVEHYPGLVVHGPLQAMMLAEHLRRVAPRATLHRFVYRGHTPAFAGQALQLEGWPGATQHKSWQLQTCAVSGAVCMSAQAEMVEMQAAPENHS